MILELNDKTKSIKKNILSIPFLDLVTKKIGKVFHLTKLE